MGMSAHATKPHAAWHVIYNEDGSFRGYEWALDGEGNPHLSKVYEQEGRLPDGSRPSAAAIRSGVERGDPFAYVRDRPVGVGVDAGQRIRAANWPTLPAVTNQPVADDPNRTNLPLGNLSGDTDGQDADAMEHERQSRLSRWQRLP